MHKIDLISGDRLPQYREALRRLQDMIFLVGELASLGGVTYIVSGCVDDGNGIISSGYVVVDGELLPFVGGQPTDKIAIKETRQDVEAFGTVYPEIYIDRVVEFDINGKYSWSDFEQLPSIAQVYKLIKDIKGAPIGIIQDWAGSVATIPDDYLLCDGRILQVSRYPELYDVIGITYGGDGRDSFNLPDTGGRVSVGFLNSHPKFGIVGYKDGENEVALASEQNGPHTHKFESVRKDSNNWRGTGEAVGSYTVYEADGVTEVSGEGKPHNNMQEYIVFPKIIKVK